jgi:DNA-directed RNA polymerase subunit H (RpoH/RPB5)
MAQSQHQSIYVVQVYKSRLTLLEILKHRGFDVSKYEEPSIHEVHIMLQQEQLDMLIEHPDTRNKVYVKYSLNKTLRPAHVFEMIDDLFNTEEVLTKQDDLLIIAKENANDTMIKELRKLWSQEQYFVNIIGLKHLQFNILRHHLVPKHRVLTDDEALVIYQKYNITDLSQLPDISRFSPVSLVIGLRPGQLCEITRSSKTSVTALFYRICSP